MVTLLRTYGNFVTIFVATLSSYGNKVATYGNLRTYGNKVAIYGNGVPKKHGKTR